MLGGLPKFSRRANADDPTKWRTFEVITKVEFIDPLGVIPGPETSKQPVPSKSPATVPGWFLLNGSPPRRLHLWRSRAIL